MSKKLSFSILAAIVTMFSTIAFANHSFDHSQLRWTQVGTQVSGYYGLPMRHCGNDSVGPGRCSWQDYRSGETCFMYWGSQDLGGGRKEYPIFQCHRGW